MSQPIHIEPSRRLRFADTRIAGGQNLSDAVPLQGYELKGLILPPAWTLADVTFQAAEPVLQVPAQSGQEVPAQPEFLDVYGDDGSPVQINVGGSSRYIVLGTYAGKTAAATPVSGRVEFLAGVDLIKVRSGTPAAPVNQAAERIVTLILGASAK